jgi:hypothetical protein
MPWIEECFVFPNIAPSRSSSSVRPLPKSHPLVCEYESTSPPLTGLSLEDFWEKGLPRSLQAGISVFYSLLRIFCCPFRLLWKPNLPSLHRLRKVKNPRPFLQQFCRQLELRTLRSMIFWCCCGDVLHLRWILAVRARCAATPTRSMIIQAISFSYPLLAAGSLCRHILVDARHVDFQSFARACSLVETKV